MNKSNGFTLVELLVAFLILTLVAQSDADETARPNILMILADDLGYSDLGCYGSEIATPNLNHLSENGLRFTQFYNTARCWPTRGALLTGFYAQQIHRDSLPELRGGVGGVRQAWARLLPELLKPAGYRSFHSGKWHIDGKVLAGGFDRSLEIKSPGNFFTSRGTFLDGHPRSHGGPHGSRNRSCHRPTKGDGRFSKHTHPVRFR